MHVDLGFQGIDHLGIFQIIYLDRRPIYWYLTQLLSVHTYRTKVPAYELQSKCIILQGQCHGRWEKWSEGGMGGGQAERQGLPPLNALKIKWKIRICGAFSCMKLILIIFMHLKKWPFCLLYPENTMEGFLSQFLALKGHQLQGTLSCDSWPPGLPSWELPPGPLMLLCPL